MLNPEHLNPETPKWERISNIEYRITNFEFRSKGEGSDTNVES
jgi:hypothetical protein